MGKLLLFLFTAIPLLEAYLLVLLGTHLGFWPTVAVVLCTGLVGAFLAKREGLKVWREWQQALAQMKMPEEGIVGGLLVLVGGVLLITPGVLTDVVGLSLLFPPSRRLIGGVVRGYLERRFAEGPSSTRVSYRVEVGGPAGRAGAAPGGVQGVRFRSAPMGAARVVGFGGPRGGAVIDTEAEVLETRRPDLPEG